jgi:hypothetical protein
MRGRAKAVGKNAQKTAEMAIFIDCNEVPMP